MALRGKAVWLITVAACALLTSVMVQRGSVAQAETERIEGNIPVSGGLALVRDVTGGIIDSLAVELAAKECNALSAWVSREGLLSGYIFGAPAYVNARFLEAYPSGLLPPETPLILLCGVAQGGTSLVYLGVEKVWNEPPIPPVREEAEYYMYLFEIRGATLSANTEVSTSFPYAEIPQGFISVMEEENRIGVVVRPWAPAFGTHNLRVRLEDGTQLVESFRHERSCDNRANWPEIQMALGIPEGLCLLWLESPEEIGRWDGALRSFAAGLYSPATRGVSVAGWKLPAAQENLILAHEACHEWQEVQNRLAHGERVDAPPDFWSDSRQHTQTSHMWHATQAGISYNALTQRSFKGEQVASEEANKHFEHFADECAKWVLFGEGADIPDEAKEWMRQALPPTLQTAE